MNAIFKTAALAGALFITMLLGVRTDATEYRPTDLNADSNNLFSKGGHSSSKNNVMTLKSPANSTVEFWNEKIAMSTGAVSVDLRFSPDASMTETRAGVVFYRTAVHDYWTFQINPSGKFCLIKYVENHCEFLKHSTSTLHANQGANVWNTVSIQTTASAVKCFVNGHEVFSCPHAPGATGKIGVQFQDPGSAEFKNFKASY